MKKLLLTLLISLNLAMPAHAYIGGGIAIITGGPITTYLMYLSAGSLQVIVAELTKNRMMSILAFVAGGLLDGEKNSENNLVSVNALNDIETLISAKIYTETEGDDLKSEWRAFESYLSESEKEFFINSEQIQGMSPEEVVATIQSQVGDRKLLAEYLASKMGVQIQ